MDIIYSSDCSNQFAPLFTLYKNACGSGFQQNIVYYSIVIVGNMASERQRVRNQIVILSVAFLV